MQFDITKVLCLADKTLTTYWPAVECLSLHHLRCWPADGGQQRLHSGPLQPAQSCRTREVSVLASAHISTFPDSQSVNANGGFWHHQKDKRDRVALSEFIISSLAFVLASGQLADAWGMCLGSAADVRCFREAVDVNVPSSLLVRYEPELNVTHRPDHLRLLENQSSSLVTSHKAKLPDCGY